MDGRADADIAVSLVSDIAEIGEADWTGLAAAAQGPYHPFTDYRFLKALEATSCTGVATGWSPAHLAARRNGALVGLAPCYLKQHSQGEYIFDHHWADAYERAGGRYYPKLLCAAPFTPATGPRLLAADDAARTALGAGLRAACSQLGLSSTHVNFVEETDRTALARAGYLHREGVQYHWFNRGYDSYDAFLAALASRKRKAIRRERREAAESGLTFRCVTGAEAREADWDAFWTFYQDTGARKWGRPYLTRAFFTRIAETMGEAALFFFADRNGRPVAGALNFIGGDTLYGRYWGCTEHHPFLHFEICYHQAIDYAIERGLARVEPGAQGEHKIARGYEPVATHSMHWIADPGFRMAIERYLDAERNQTEADIGALGEFTPFRKG